MDIKEEFISILCKDVGASPGQFDLKEYLDEGWITEDDVYKTIRKLITQKQGRRI